MFENLEIMRTAHAMAAHSGARQALVAENIANADTPGYRGRDLRPFADVFRQSKADAMRVTRDGHISAPDVPQAAFATEPQPGISPNGNSVSIEVEMIKAVDLRQSHETALSIYRFSANIIRASLGRMG